MTSPRLFVDSAPVIYLVEKNPAFIERVSLYLAEAIKQDNTLVTSVLTLAEVEIKPRKLQRTEVLTKFDRTIKSLFEVKTITWDIAELSATLRAKYSPLKAIDSLQTACALRTKCEKFVRMTGD